MALSAATEWEVRTTGDNSNGGGFNTASSGTDYSQQDAAQVTYTDLVIGGTNTQLTSAANPFTSAHIGNIVNITGGTGFTAGRYEVVSVAASVATMDRAVGTASSTGGAGKLGGALLTISAGLSAAAGNTASSTQDAKVYVKAGTYTVAAAIAVVPGNVRIAIIGYSSVRGDRGTRPLITTATNSTILFTVNTSFNVRFTNLHLTNTAATRAIGIASVAGNYPSVILDNCILDGFTYGIKGDNSGNTATTAYLFKTEIKNCTAGGVLIWWNLTISGCYIHDNVGDGLIKTSSQNQWLSVTDSIIAHNTRGIVATSGIVHIEVYRCTIAGNTSHGIALLGGDAVFLKNNIIYGNGGYGVSGGVAGDGHDKYVPSFANAYGANASGNRSALPAGIGDVALTENPFMDSGAGNYSLNNAAGGGALCKGAGFKYGP